jgi:hypothetical protein
LLIHVHVGLVLRFSPGMLQLNICFQVKISDKCGPPFVNKSVLWSSLLWDVMWLWLVVSYRFGTTYRSHVQGSSSQRINLLGLLDCLTLEDGTDKLSRNAVSNYQSILCKIPEERRPQPHRGVSLKSGKSILNSRVPWEHGLFVGTLEYCTQC